MHPMIRRSLWSVFFPAVVILIAPFGGIGGCGGGSAAGTSSVSVGGGTLAAIANATSAVSASVGQSATAALVVPTSGCITSEDSDGSLTSICTVDCEAGGKIQGSQTTTTILNYGEFSSCSLYGNAGMERDITGTTATTFTDCAVETCGQELVLNGSLSGALQIIPSGCGYSIVNTTSYETSGSCSGLSITAANGSTVEVGLRMTNVNSTVNGLTQFALSGSLCENGNTTTFGDREEFLKAVDPDGVCADSGNGDSSECDQCVDDCVAGAAKDGTSSQDALPGCRKICGFRCGDYDCTAEGDQKCRDAAGLLAPAGLEASYEAATKCSKFNAYPCLIACDQADPDNKQRCADMAVNQIHALVSPSLFGSCVGQSCYFTYACAGADDFAACPEENVCTSSSVPTANYCGTVRTCQSDSECGEGVCVPVAGRDFNHCDCAPNDTDGCVLIP